MTRAGLWVALEGPCCAGKTTLTQGLRAALRDRGTAYVECFADHAGGGRLLPPETPRSLAEDEAGLRQLLDIEASRTADALSHPTAVVLLDRSLLTLLAHRYALERVTGLPCYQPATRTLAGLDIPTWPDLVLYLDVPQKIVLDRNKGKFADDSILINPVFNAGIRDYFARLDQPDGARVVWVDATAGVAQSVDYATSHIMRLLPARHG